MYNYFPVIYFSSVNKEMGNSYNSYILSMKSGKVEVTFEATY